MANLQFREAVKSLLPPWLLRANGYMLAAAWSALADVAAQLGVEGLAATLPRHGTPTALPYHGRDRGLVRGPYQAATDYAEQLTQYLSLWRRAGGAVSLARNIQWIMSPNRPKVRVVTRTGFWTTVDTDGSLSFKHGTAWDWDSVTHPERFEAEHDGEDCWVIVYSPSLAKAGTFGDAAYDLWGQKKAFGNDTPTSNVEAIKALCAKWKGAHARVRCLIFTYDAASFDPNDATTFPTDGLWGNWSKVVGGQQVPSRFANARYWDV